MSRQASRFEADASKAQSRFFCYVDESGTPAIPGNTSHFVLCGISVPVWHWKTCERDITAIKNKYGLRDAEIHTAWIARRCLEQSKIPGFKDLNYASRRREVGKIRNARLIELQKTGGAKYRRVAKNYKKTEPYIHLTEEERTTLLLELAQCVGNWGYARLFAECIDKIDYDISKIGRTVDEQAFENVVSRFEKYLRNIESGPKDRQYGLVIHDNNPTVAKRHTQLMMRFRDRGTFFTEIDNIIETPLFVDSQLTRMVQIADLCAYALRRYLENDESQLFDEIFKRADRFYKETVGVRHFTENNCGCKICKSHGSQNRAAS